MIKAYPLGLLILLILALSYSCKPYSMMSRGYLVRGEDNLVSVDQKLSVFLGPMLTSEIWNTTETPLNLDTPNKDYTKLLNQLGYSRDSHVMLFSRGHNLPYELIGLVNLPMEKEFSTNEQIKHIINRLQWKKTNDSRWFYEVQENSGEVIYHALIPISDKLFNEKYLTLIYKGPVGSDLEAFENVIQLNAQSFQNAGYYLSNMQLLDCSTNTGDDKYHNYFVPLGIYSKTLISKVQQREDNLFIIKVFERNNEDKLVFYRLLETPPISQGAFKICSGQYTLQYTTLSGKVLWSEDFEIE